MDDSDDGADGTDNRAEGDRSAGESDNEGACLGAMTPDGQDHYLRLGDMPRQRSALRLSRLIARKMLIRRLEQGRLGDW